jgi:hypothetical protein
VKAKMELFSHFNYIEHANGKKINLDKTNTARTLYLKIDDEVYANLMPGQVHKLIFGASICSKQDQPSKKKARELCQKMTKYPYTFKVISVEFWSDEKTDTTKKKVWFQKMERQGLPDYKYHDVLVRKYLCISETMSISTVRWSIEEVLWSSRWH